jgi:hypothetical protein
LRSKLNIAWVVAALCGLAAYAVGCSSSSDTPPSTRVRLTVRGLGALPQAPASLRLRLYGQSGRLFTRRLPELDDAGGALIYSPLADGSLRLLLLANNAAGERLAEGFTRVDLVAGGEVEATIELQTDAAPDGDGDGVPDDIDNCPTIENPEQGPCHDGGVGDAAPADGGPGDLAPLPDGAGDSVDAGDVDAIADAGAFDTSPDAGCAPLAGAYTIKKGGSGARVFGSFASAVGNLSTCGVSGPVVITAESGVFSSQSGFYIPAVPGASAQATVTFRGSSAGAPTRLVGADGKRYVVMIGENARFITLEDLTIDASETGNALSASPGGLVMLHMSGGQQDITFRRLRLLELEQTDWTSTGRSAALSLALTPGKKATRITVESCRFDEIEAPKATGLQAALLVTGGAVDGLTIKGNRFYSLLDTHAILIASAPVSDLDVHNNMFTILGNDARAALRLEPGFGAQLQGSPRFVFNSVLVQDNDASAVSGSWSLPLVVRSNALDAFTGKNNTELVDSTSPVNGGGNCIDKEASFGYGASSTDKKVGDVDFNKASVPFDLHLQLTSDCRNQGVSVSGVTTDIDGQPRDSTPDPGADEL